MNRGTFLRQTGISLAACVTAGVAIMKDLTAKENLNKPSASVDSQIKKWDIITIGNLSRNRYWGESDEKAIRSSICTCTLITGEGFRLLVDPSLRDSNQMASELDRRAGIKPGDISMVFITHEHADHWYGLSHFPEARWLAAPEVARNLNRSGNLTRRVEESPDQLFDAVQVISTPGHTPSHHSLAFVCNGMRIVVAGDSVMTIDFFRERRGYLNSVDFELAAQTIGNLAKTADIIVPGHDNYFLVSIANKTK